MLDAWSPKEITTLLVQCGALGLCFLMMLIGIYMCFQLIMKIDRLHNSIFKLSCLVVDRNARPDEMTPPERPRTRPYLPESSEDD